MSNLNLDQAVIDSALEGVQAINQIRTSAKLQFVAMNPVIDALATSVASGTHLCILGRPGLAKSLLVHFFATSSRSNYFRLLANPGVTEDELFGPVSLEALAHDQWDRPWTNLGEADFAFIDEIGKANDRVRNLLLNVMEERIANATGAGRRLPLHTLVSASNEIFSATSDATWDRFHQRLYITDDMDGASFMDMLTTRIEPVDYAITREQLFSLRKAASEIALASSVEIKEILLHLRETRDEAANSYISPRRWRETLRVAAGSALLKSQIEITASDLLVACNTLWTETEEIAAVNQWIKGTLNIDLDLLATKRREFEEIRAQNQVLLQAAIDSSKDVNEILTHKGALLSELGRLYSAIKDQPTLQAEIAGDWQALIDDLEELRTQMRS